MKTNAIKFHVGLHVSNIERSTGFYREFLQTEPLKQFDDYAKFETDQIVLSLIQKENGAKPGFGHFGLRVSTDEQLQARHKKLEKEGYTMLVEEKTDCCYALQDKFWVKDPDGYNWEVYTFLGDTKEGLRPEAEKAGEEVCCSPGCC
ncbi:MAG: glyoxalase/bleomycin resistance/dioxygenase family protein [Bacteroidetes bacterium]|nr:glyoxalase/bleomycin resistance/dioxygenase family protein [Bacteroidota bacterium]